MYGNRFFKTAPGIDAEVFVPKAVAYTVQTDVKGFQASAVEGEIGVFNADTNAVVTTAPAAGTKLFIAVKRDGKMDRSAPFKFNAAEASRLAYVAPVKHVITVVGSGVNARLINANTKDINYYAKTNGVIGNSYQVEYIVAGNNTLLTVTASTTKVTVNLATNGGGTATSTATQVVAAIIASAAASLLVFPVAAVGATVQTAMAATSLAGGTAEQTVAKGDRLSVLVIETTPSIEPLPRWEYEVEVKAAETFSQSIARLIIKINNPAGIENYGKTRVVNAALDYTVDANNFTLSAIDFNSHFTIVLRGKFQDDASTFSVTTQFKFGLGSAAEVALMEQASDIRKGVTTNYPALGVPSEYGAPSQFALAANTYNIFKIAYTAEDQTRTLGKEFRKNYIFIACPAAGGPDTALDAIF